MAEVLDIETTRNVDLLSAETIRQLCACEVDVPAYQTRTMQTNVPNVTLASLASGLSHVGPPVHVFVTWMLPCDDDPALEAERQAALSSPGQGRQMLCWLPDAMEAYEARRAKAGWAQLLDWDAREGELRHIQRQPREPALADFNADQF